VVEIGVRELTQRHTAMHYEVRWLLGPGYTKSPEASGVGMVIGKNTIVTFGPKL